MSRRSKWGFRVDTSQGVFPQAGVGHHSGWQCGRCGEIKPQLGSRKWRGALMQCAGCASKDRSDAMPPPSPLRPALNDRQIGRMSYRIELFKRRGVDEERAERLACRLQSRDADADDRRMCLECSNLQRGGTCFAAKNKSLVVHVQGHQFTPITDVLHRCPTFSFQTP